MTTYPQCGANITRLLLIGNDTDTVEATLYTSTMIKPNSELLDDGRDMFTCRDETEISGLVV